jgi:DNA-binding NtrC family response regulator
MLLFYPGIGMPGLPKFCGSRGIPMLRPRKNAAFSQFTVERRKMSARAREQALALAWPKTVKQLQNVYDTAS